MSHLLQASEQRYLAIPYIWLSMASADYRGHLTPSARAAARNPLPTRDGAKSALRGFYSSQGEGHEAHMHISDYRPQRDSGRAGEGYQRKLIGSGERTSAGSHWADRHSIFWGGYS